MIFSPDPVLDTRIFTTIFVIVLILSMKPRSSEDMKFSVKSTQELKGFAILVILFAHIGYIISPDDRLLWPLSNLASVGVHMFLFLSGYGLAYSQIKKPLSIGAFYKRRLGKLYIPLWIILPIFFVADYFLLGRTYSAKYIGLSFLGIFKSADVAYDVNSPLWYFTFIAFYYVLFPIVFSKKRPWVSSIVIFIITFALLHLSFIENIKNIELYKVYTGSFPLGILVAWLSIKESSARNSLTHAFRALSWPLRQIPKGNDYIKSVLLTTIGVLLLGLITYSRVLTTPWDSTGREQVINLLTMLAVCGFIIINRYPFRLFDVFGLYAYEIYLIHLPIMYRYDVLYKYFPAWLATILYAPLLLLLSKLLHHASQAAAD